MNDYNIKKLYEDMEMELISSMKRNYKRHLKEEKKTGFEYSQWQAEKLKELKRYQRENKDIIDGYTRGLSDEVSQHLKKELKQGSINAINQYNKIMGKNLKPNKIMNHSFFRINDKKVNALIKVVNNDLKMVNTAVLRMANDQYRQVIHKSAFFVANGVFTEKQAANMATKELTELQRTKLAIDEANKDFLSRGFNCVEYKNGRRVNIASYSQMAIRTANLRAQLMGEGDFRKSIGRVLVQSTSHGGACPICQKWEGKIFIDDVYSGGTKKDGKYMLLSEAMKQGFLHPNCRHGLTTYYPELDAIENYTDEEYEEDVSWINNKIDEIENNKLNYIDRNIKRFNRLENGSIAPLNIQMFTQKKYNLIREKEKLVTFPYTDVTNNWIENADPNSHKILDAEYFVFEKNKYKVDGKNVILDYSKKEKEVAEWLESTLGGELYMIPRINNPSGIQTADYLFKNEYWDLKEINGNGKNVFFHAVENHEKQSHNFIFDVTNSSLTDLEIDDRIKFLYKLPKLKWLDKIIIKRGKKLIKITKKK